jgi:choline transport protein
MARDDGIPYSRYFAHVSDRFGIPLRAMIVILVIDLIIGKPLHQTQQLLF